MRDFKGILKLRPAELGISYTYVWDVLLQLNDWGVIKIVDDRLRINDLRRIPWLEEELLFGNRECWSLVNSVENQSNKPLKFNPEILMRLGLEGEMYVLNQLRNALPTDLHQSIFQISTIDDTAGYDIRAPSVLRDGVIQYLEVKTTSRPILSTFDFYLSRNEFNIGIKDPNWSIVGVSFLDGSPSLMGHIKAHQIESRMPENRDYGVKWETVKVQIEPSLWREGLP